jgi:hypothetical protein
VARWTPAVVALVASSARVRAPEVNRHVIHTSSLYKACSELFADYPLAAATDECTGTVAGMVILSQDQGELEFFVLSQQRDEAGVFFSISPWPAGENVIIEDDEAPAVPDAMATAIASGVPIPRHGSLLGWRSEDSITALIAIYSEYTSDCPQPRWTVMPRDGLRHDQWPPFTDEIVLGHWFWEYYKTGKIVLLDDLIGSTTATVFWIDTQQTLGSDCCAIACDVISTQGFTLRRGCYVYYEALRIGGAVPPMKALLADANKVDLASRFNRSCLD